MLSLVVVFCVFMAKYFNLDIQKAQVNTSGFEDKPLRGCAKLAHKGA